MRVDRRGRRIGERAFNGPVVRWTRENVIQAIATWAAAHGGIGPRVCDMYHTGGELPSPPVVVDLFGSVAAATRAAGALPPRRPGGRRWTRCKAGHDLTAPGTCYQWQYKGKLRRRCKHCHRERARRDTATKRPRPRVPARPLSDTAARHSPAALAAYWGMAS